MAIMITKDASFGIICLYIRQRMLSTKFCSRPIDNNVYSIDRPPYRPKIASTEYMLCELSGEFLQICHCEWNDNIRVNIYDMMTKICTHGRSYNTIVHCGYA